MKILTLSWKCSRHPRAGGAEVFTHEVLNRLGERGHEVTLFSSAPKGLSSSESLGAYAVTRSGSRLSVYRHARRLFAAAPTQWDVLLDQVNTIPFNTPRWAGETPVVALFHQLAREIWWYETPLALAFLGRVVLEPLWIRRYRSALTLTLSRSSAASLNAAGLSDVRIVGVGRSVPPKLPRIVKAPHPLIAFVGRLTRSKRPHHVLRAFGHIRRELPSAQLIIVGGGPLERTLRAKKIPHVTFTGWVEEPRKFEILARAHVLVVTSVREGWGLVVDEAAAVGTPTVAYRVAGLIDSVPAARGVLVKPNPDALAKAVVSLLSFTSPATSGWKGGASDWDDVTHRVESALAESVDRHRLAGRHA